MSKVAIERFCATCGKPLPLYSRATNCGECAKQNLREIFKENPEYEVAFKQTLNELKKPENIKKMAGDIARVMDAVVLAKGGKLNE